MATVRDAEPCAGDPTVLCFDNLDGTTTDPLIDQHGNPVRTPAGGDNFIGELDRTSQEAESFGGSLQGVNKARIFGHSNQFLLGGSIDHGRVGYQTNAEIGSIGPQFTITGDGRSFKTPTSNRQHHLNQHLLWPIFLRHL